MSEHNGAWYRTFQVCIGLTICALGIGSVALVITYATWFIQDWMATQ